VYDSKRMIGRAKGDNKLSEHSRTWPFNVIEDDSGRHMITFVEEESKEPAQKRFYPEEISAMVLE